MYTSPFQIVFTNERLITPSGLGIVGGVLGKSEFVKWCIKLPPAKAGGVDKRLKVALRLKPAK